jgi:hypothetical protein
MSLLTGLPEEVLELVLARLDGPATLAFGACCVQLRRLTGHPRVWRRLLAATGVVVVPREVARRAGGDARAAYFLCHRLRRNWAEGRARETELARGGCHHHMAASAACAALYGTDSARADPMMHYRRTGYEEAAARRESDDEVGPDTLKVCDLSVGAAHWGQAHPVPLPENSLLLDLGTTYVLDDYVVLLKQSEVSYKEDVPLEARRTEVYYQADMMVVSVQAQRHLYTQEKALSLRDFMRGYMMDTVTFGNYIAAVRQLTITLHLVTEEAVVVTVLDVEPGLQGLLQYCKFLAWDDSHLAHPFQAMPGDMREQDIVVEHRIYCWDRYTWRRQHFTVVGRVNDTQKCLALHGGKLFAAQTDTVRVWDLETGALLRSAQLSMPETGLLAHTSFLFTEGIGLHLQPELELLVGVVTGHLGNRAVYTVVVFSLDWELVARVNIPTEKNLVKLKVHLLGPRVVAVYCDNSYSVLDLETLPTMPSLTALPTFPLGSALKHGALVSQRSMALSQRGTAEEVYTMNAFSSVSAVNIVISHCRDGTEHVQCFSFL